MLINKEEFYTYFRVLETADEVLPLLTKNYQCLSAHVMTGPSGRVPLKKVYYKNCPAYHSQYGCQFVSGVIWLNYCSLINYGRIFRFL